MQLKVTQRSVAFVQRNGIMCLALHYPVTWLPQSMGSFVLFFLAFLFVSGDLFWIGMTTNILPPFLPRFLFARQLIYSA
jgi:hypothetical protein